MAWIYRMDVIPSTQWLKRQFHRHLSLNYLPLYLIIVWVLLYLPSFRGLIDRWTAWDQSMAHGIPVMLVFVGLLYQRLPWRMEQTLSSVERWFALILLLGSSLLWSLAQQIHIDILEQLLLLPLLVLPLWFLFGFRTLWQQRLLFVLPLFAIPIWDYLNEPLLLLSAEVVGQMVRWVQMPAIIQGDSIFIPHGHILIADGCSGLRYLVVALGLAYMVGLLNRGNEGHMLVLLAIAALLGLVTNWLRIFILIVVGYKTEMQSPLMADHEYFGWLLFALVCLPALYWAPVVKHPGLASSATAESMGRLQPAIVAVAILAMALGPAVSAFAQRGFSEQAPDASVPARAQSVPLERMPMPVTAPEADLTQSFRLSGTNAYLRRDQYLQNHPSEKLVPYVPRLYDAQRWQPIRTQTKLIAGRPVSWTLFREKATNRYLVQGQWFTVGQYYTDSVPKAKLWQLAASLKGQNRFSINSLQASCPKVDCERIQSELEALMAARWGERNSNNTGNKDEKGDGL